MKAPCCMVCGGCEVLELERKYIRESGFSEFDNSALYYIWLCNTCGYVFQNTNLSNSDLNAYYQKYAFNFHTENSTDISRFVQSERIEKAKSRFEFIQPYLNKDQHLNFLEIGCGDGKLLSLFKQEGTTLLGCELNKAHHKACQSLGIDIVELSSDFVDPKIQAGVDVVLMSHVLEHIPNPRSFLSKLHSLMSGSCSLLYIEVPDEMQIVSPNNFSLEHVSYFFQPVLAKLLQDCGFHILLQDRVTYETTPPSLRFICTPKGERELSLLLGSYQNDLLRKKNSFVATFRSDRVIALKQNKVALFGGGDYAVNFIELSGIVPVVIFDNNPNKAGVSLAGVTIQPVTNAADYVFDTLVITSWGSASEIEKQLNNNSCFENVNIIKIQSLIPKTEVI